MGNFQSGGNRGSSFRGNGNGGKPAFQKKSWGDDRPKVMHQATCSECNNACEVPFKPTGEKPVYCNNCFSAKRTQGDDRGPRPSFGDRGPRKPFGDRPNYQSSPRPSFTPTKSDDGTKKQLTEISSKLDRLISVMDKLAGTAKAIPVSLVPIAKIIPAIKTFSAPSQIKKIEPAKPLVKTVLKKKPAIKAKKKK